MAPSLGFGLYLGASNLGAGVVLVFGSEYGAVEGVGVDNTAAFLSLSNAIGARGGRCTVIFPAGRWETSANPLEITSSNVTVIERGDIVFTGSTVPARCIWAHGLSGAHIKGPRVIFQGGSIDGGGSGVTWTYSSGDRYDAVLFEYADDAYIGGGGSVANGLVSCVKAYKCRRPIYDQITATNSVHDNCLSFSQDPDDYDAGDEDTWCNGRANNCTTTGAKDFGQTAFNASGCIFTDPVVSNCGTNDTTGGEYTGGGISIESGTSAQKILHGQIIRPQISNVRTSGIFVTGSEVVVTDPSISGVTSGSPQLYQGHGICIFSADGLTVSGTGSITGADKAGIYGLAGTYGSPGLEVKYTSVDVSGAIEVYGNVANGIDVRGFSDVSIGSGVHAHDNSGNDQIYLHNNGTGVAYNTGAGVAVVASQVDGAVRRSVRVTDCATATVSGVSGRNNRPVNSDIPIQLTSIGVTETIGNTIYEDGAGVPVAVIALDTITTASYWNNGGTYSGGSAVQATSVGTSITSPP